MADSWDFGKLLIKYTCDKILYAWQTGRKSIKELDDGLQYILLRRARLLEEKDNVLTICFHHEQFFGKLFERKADKCCSKLRSYPHNSKAHRVINLEMTKILEEKGFNDAFTFLDLGPPIDHWTSGSTMMYYLMYYYSWTPPLIKGGE